MSFPRLKKETSPKEVTEERSSQSVMSLEKISRAILYFLVFALPLFFWPGLSNVNVLDFPKQFLLAALVLMAAFLWLLEVFGREKIGLRFSFIYIPATALLVFWGASALFSLSRYGSLWGWPLRVNESFLSLFVFVLISFLIYQTVRTRSEMILFLILLVSSGFLVSLFGFLQIWGKFLLPFDFSRVASFNTIGTPSALAVFAAALLPLTVGMITGLGSWMRGLFILAATFMFIIVVTVNSWFAWVTLFVGSAFYLGLMALQRGLPHGLLGVRALLLPMVLVAVSLLFLLTREPFPGLPSVPTEVYPTHRATLQINLQALKERPVLGTGPGTFIFNYSKFKNPAVNQTVFWDARFRVGASKIVDSFGTGGILGGLAYLFLLGSVFYIIWQKIIRRGTAKPLDIAMTSGLVGAVTGQAVSSSSFTLDFVFWVLLGLFCVVLTPENLVGNKVKSIIGFISRLSAKFSAPGEKESGGAISPSDNIASVVLSFAIVVLLAIGIGFFYSGAKRISAEMAYIQGLRAFSEGNLQTSAEKLTRATRLNPGQDTYWRDLAQVYLVSARQELSRQDLPKERAAQNALNFMGLAVNGAQKATELEPNNVANWSVRGFIYRNLIGAVGGAEDAAFAFGYERALKLEPANPYLAAEMGHVYLQRAILAQQQQKSEDAQDNLAKAAEWFNKAVALKPDYAPAHFQLAIVAELKGDTQQVITKLLDTRQYVTDINDFVGLSFRLGVLYYRLGEYDKAKTELEAAVLGSPDYSNARYFLGLIYDREGKKAAAIEQFERIEKLNPDNELVKTILDNLRQGRPALAGTTPEEPPQVPVPEGQPEEIRE